MDSEVTEPWFTPLVHTLTSDKDQPASYYTPRTQRGIERIFRLASVEGDWLRLEPSWGQHVQLVPVVPGVADGWVRSYVDGVNVYDGVCLCEYMGVLEYVVS